MEYIDVRGPWPIYVNGARAYKLEGKTVEGKEISRAITIEEARAQAAVIDAEQEAARPTLERHDS